MSLDRILYVGMCHEISYKYVCVYVRIHLDIIFLNINSDMSHSIITLMSSRIMKTKTVVVENEDHNLCLFIR